MSLRKQRTLWCGSLCVIQKCVVLSLLMWLASVLQTVAVFGGMGRSELCSSAEILAPPNSQWQGLPPMRLPRWGSGAASLESEVYVAGGSDNSSRLSSVERFDLRTMKWSPAPHLNVPRNGVGLAAHNGECNSCPLKGLSDLVISDML